MLAGDERNRKCLRSNSDLLEKVRRKTGLPLLAEPKLLSRGQLSERFGNNNLICIGR